MGTPYLINLIFNDISLTHYLLFENPVDKNGVPHGMPVLTNLFGTPDRVALAMGQPDVHALRDVGKLLAMLKEPEPPKGFRDAILYFEEKGYNRIIFC